MVQENENKTPHGSFVLLLWLIDVILCQQETAFYFSKITWNAIIL